MQEEEEAEGEEGEEAEEEEGEVQAAVVRPVCRVFDPSFISAAV